MERTVQEVIRWPRPPTIAITAIGGRCNEHPYEEDGNKLKDAERDELEEPVQTQNSRVPFGTPSGWVCDEGDWHGGVWI